MDTKILRSLSYGVYIVTAMDGDRPCGCTANSIMQITSEPQTVAVSLNHANRTNEVVKATGRLAVNILAETSDAALIGGFGFVSSRDVDKFEGVAHEMVDGLPVLNGTCGYMILEVRSFIETSTHTVFIAEMTDARVLDPAAVPMTYAYYHDVVKGKTAKNAPTYIPEIDGDAAADGSGGAEEKKGVWVCKICGYAYTGDVPFEDLPDDWTCPLCKAPKSQFEFREQ